MDEDRFIQETAKIMQDDTVLPVQTKIKEAWLLVSALQLATRHPALSATMKTSLEAIGRQFQSAIVNLHPEAQLLIESGWDERFDVDEGDGMDVNVPTPQIEANSLKPVNNCWTIYMDGLKEGESALATVGRPQDWGHPRWMYRVYTLEANGYRHTVHCWVDVAMKDHEHLQLFTSLMTQIMLPGWPVELSGRDFMGEDDLWNEEWGKMPPYFEREDDF